MAPRLVRQAVERKQLLELIDDEAEPGLGAFGQLRRLARPGQCLPDRCVLRRLHEMVRDLSRVVFELPEFGQRRILEQRLGQRDDRGAFCVSRPEHRVAAQADVSDHTR